MDKVVATAAAAVAGVRDRASPAAVAPTRRSRTWTTAPRP